MVDEPRDEAEPIWPAQWLAARWSSACWRSLAAGRAELRRRREDWAAFTATTEALLSEALGETTTGGPARGRRVG